MAGVKGLINVAGVASGTSAKTLLQLEAPAQQRVLLKGWSISFRGISPTAVPVRVELLRQTTAGTMTSATEIKQNSADNETIQTVGQHTATSEPTGGEILRTINVHPQMGFAQVFPLGEEIHIPGGTRLGLRVTAAATVDCDAELIFEE